MYDEYMDKFVALVGNGKLITNYYIRSKKDIARRRMLGANECYDVVDACKLAEIVEETDYSIKYMVGKSIIDNSSECIIIPANLGLDIIRLNVCSVVTTNRVSLMRFDTRTVPLDKIYKDIETTLTRKEYKGDKAVKKGYLNSVVKSLMCNTRVIEKGITDCIVSNGEAVSIIERNREDTKKENLKVIRGIEVELDDDNIHRLTEFCIMNGMVIANIREDYESGVKIIQLMVDSRMKSKYKEMIEYIKAEEV